MSHITKSVNLGQKLVAHLTNALEDTTYSVYFSPILNATQDTDFAPIIRGNVELNLATKNTPLILELAGTYRFVKIVGTGDECILLRADAVDSFVGDIK